MGFIDQYEAIVVLNSRCRRARDRRTGAAVLLHTPSNAAEAVQLLRQSGLLLAQVEQSGQACLVTGDKPDLIDLQTWLQRNRAQGLGEFSQMFDAPPQPAPGEFTRQFRTPSDSHAAEAPPATSAPGPGPLDVTQTMYIPVLGATILGPVPEPEPPLPPPPPPEPEPAPMAREPDEITRMFRPAAVPVSPSSRPADEKQGASAPSPVDAEPPPGEFTRMFRPVAEPNPPPSRPPDEKQGESAPSVVNAEPPPGEFTRMFRPAADPFPTALKARNRRDAWRFTQLFRPAAPESEPGLPSASVSDERTHLFTTPPPEPQSTASFTQQLYQQPPAPPPSMPPPAPEVRDFESFYDSPYQSNQAAMDTRLQSQVPPAPERPMPRDESEFTGLFGRTGTPSGEPVGPATPLGATGVFIPRGAPSRPPGYQPSVSAESEWTRVFRPPVSTPAPKVQQPAPSKPESQSAPAQSKTLLIVSIVLGVLLLIAIGTIVFLLMRH